MQLDSPKLAIVGFALGMVSALTGVFGWFPAEAAWSFAGLFGFGGVAALRAYIRSFGRTTYIYVGAQVVNTVLFSAFQIYDLVTYQTLMGLIASLTGIGITNGYRKAINPG